MLPGFSPIGRDPLMAGPIVAELPQLLLRLDNLQKEIDSLRPLDADKLGRIVQRFRIDWNYHSNNIEGNSYDYGETKAFLLHGITAGGKPLRDSLEIKGHNEVILGLEDLIHSQTPLTEHTIREIHKKILGDDPYSISAESPDGKLVTKMVIPGRYKQEPNHVRTATGETFYFAEPFEVPAKMQELLEWYRAEDVKKELHPVVLAAVFHYRFVRIHPFDDGNGRMARILMNLVLMKNEFPVVIVKTEDKENYYRALRQADGDDLDAFVSYIAKQEIASQELWLRGARGESLEDLDKEVALLKASLRNPPKRKPIDRSKLIREVIENVFQPLVTSVDENLKTFDEFFEEKEANVIVTFQGKEDKSINLQDLLDRQKDFSSLYGIRFCIIWRDSSNANLEIPRVRRAFELVFGEDGYNVMYGEVYRFGKKFGETLSSDEITKLVAEAIRSLIDYIRSKANKAGY
jgi:Fic family protein